jgi:hypothetical protein
MNLRNHNLNKFVISIFELLPVVRFHWQQIIMVRKLIIYNFVKCLINKTKRYN